MTGDQDEDSAPSAWHNSTAKLLGASVAALAAIALVVGGVMFASRQMSQPEPAPLDFVDPTFTSRSESTTATTTSTITSTVPPITTDINPSDTSEMETSEDSETSETSGSETPSEAPTTRSEVAPDEDDDGPQTTRNRPRLNETRTLYPRP